MSETHDDWLKKEKLTDLAFPICCETEDLEGRWELVSLTKWLGNGKWMAFDLSGLHLAKGQTYGFRLESPDSYIGMGEAAGSAQQPPFNNGKEWKFTNNDQKGDSYSYFSLAFKVEIRA